MSADESPVEEATAVEMTVLERLSEVGAWQPGRVAIVDGPVRLTYHDLLGRSAALACLLRERFELREGSSVAVSLPHCWQGPVCFFGVAGWGGVFMPFNPQWRANEIGGFVRSLGIAAVITCQELRPIFDDERAGVSPERILTIDAPEVAARITDVSRPSELERTRVEDTTPALFLATSGSTGRPKVAPRSHRNLLAGSGAVAAALGTTPGHRFLSVIPFHHANGFANGLFLPLVSGATIVLARRALPSMLAECVAREGVQVINMSPFLYSLLADHVEPEAFAGVEIYLSSGAALPPAVARQWRERFGRPVRELYGSTETGTISIGTPDGSPDPGVVGKPLPSVTVRILDQEGEPLPPGCTGEIAVCSPAMMSGYVDDRESNEQAFRGGFFRMGDLGHITAAGELVIEGRSKRWINSGGVKVDPVEVENVLRRLPAVQDCHVRSGRNDRELEVLTVVIVLRPEQAATRGEILEHCRQHLAEYKIPRLIRIVESTDMDPTGKSPWSRSHP